MTLIPLSFKDFEPLLKQFNNYPTHHYRDKKSYLLYKPTDFGIYVCQVDFSDIEEDKFKLEFLGNSVELPDRIR